MVDVCIVGAGPAGLNAALVLGRCRRAVLVFDSGQPRNAVSRALHGYLSRNGIAPAHLCELGRAEIGAHPSVRFVHAEVSAIRRQGTAFEIVTTDGQRAEALVVLLATGRIDVLSDIPGFRAFYGRGVYHCPYCDGWEHRDQRLIAFGDAPAAVELALELLTWSRHVTLCLGDSGSLSEESRGRLEANGIVVASSAITTLSGQPGRDVEIAQLADGSVLPCDALFFISACPQKSPLAADLGCRLDDAGSVVCTQHAATGVPGLYVAGNVRGGVHLAIMAAAEGAEAAIAINEDLAERKLRGRPGM